VEKISLSRILNDVHLKDTLDLYARSRNLLIEQVQECLCRALKISLEETFSNSYEVSVVQGQIKIKEKGSIIDPFIENASDFVKRFLKEVRHELNLLKVSRWEQNSIKGSLISIEVKRIATDGILGVYEDIEAYGSKFEMVRTDLRIGQEVKVLVKDIKVERNQVRLIVSRRGEDFLEKVLIDHVPEYKDGEIRAEILKRFEGVKSFFICPAGSSNTIKILLGVKANRIKEIRSHLTEKLVVTERSFDLEEMIRKILPSDTLKDISREDKNITISLIRGNGDFNPEKIILELCFPDYSFYLKYEENDNITDR
jgi:transcription antitermination factor NusA-like protein